MLPPAVRALARNVPTVAPVPNKGLIAVTGSQAAEFLNGVVSTHVSPSNPHHSFSAFLHAQGRVLHDIFLYSQPSATGKPGYIIEYDNRTVEDVPSILPMLQRYVLRAKVKLRDVSSEYDVWAAWGSEKEKLWETERHWKSVRSGVFEPVWDAEGPSPWGSEPGVLRDRRAVGLGERLLVNKGDRPRAASTHDIGSESDYILHRILRGVPEGVTDIIPGHSFPMESNMDLMGGLDFRKGCYVGQELTVRTYHTGMVRKRIFPVMLHQHPRRESDTELQIHDVILSPHLDIRTHLQPATDGTPRPRPRGTGKLLTSEKGVGLALLRMEHVDAVMKGDAQLEIESSDGEHKTNYGVTPWRPSWWPVTEPESELY
ncbi:putative transferase CAF17, mitochondrial [Abortiporus biennis]